jgi:diacylglycerol kinase
MKDIKKFIKSLKCALAGIKAGFGERHMKFHIVAAIGVWLTGCVLGLDRVQWFVIYILIALVLSAELFNTAIEELADLIKNEEHLSYNATKKVRDLSAGAVLVISLMAAFLGGGIFLVRFLQLLGWG